MKDFTYTVSPRRYNYITIKLNMWPELSQFQHNMFFGMVIYSASLRDTTLVVKTGYKT